MAAGDGSLSQRSRSLSDAASPTSGALDVWSASSFGTLSMRGAELADPPAGGHLSQSLVNLCIRDLHDPPECFTSVFVSEILARVPRLRDLEVSNWGPYDVFDVPRFEEDEPTLLYDHCEPARLGRA